MLFQPALAYFGLFSQFTYAPLKFHMLWFYKNDMNYCMGVQNVNMSWEISSFVYLAFAQKDRYFTRWNEVFWRSKLCFQWMTTYPSSKFIWWEKFCFNKLTIGCNVVSNNMEWEGYSMHIAIYSVKTTLQSSGRLVGFQ